LNQYKKLENQPLTFVLAEFRFSPVEKIVDYIPAIQEGVRRQFPIFEKREEQTLQFDPAGMTVSRALSWAFLSADRKNAIDVNQNRIIYMTSDYPRFAGFSEACRKALDTLIGEVAPGLIFQIGLRYGDMIIPGNNTIDDLVDSHFAIPPTINKLNPISGQHRTETYLQTEFGKLMIRTLYGTSNLTILPDIQNLPIALDHVPDASERLIIDFDHIWQAEGESVVFETDTALDRLDDLHKVSREAFWEITTDYAKDEIWS
jgi:uncharacterized protein (TIGR04255 family)